MASTLPSGRLPFHPLPEAVPLWLTFRWEHFVLLPQQLKAFVLGKKKVQEMGKDFSCVLFWTLFGFLPFRSLSQKHPLGYNLC